MQETKTNATDSAQSVSAVISGLYCYPVKSCAGFSLPSTEVTAQGVEGDRQWMIVDENMRMYTQRKNPHLALIKAEYVGEDGFSCKSPSARIRLSHLQNPSDSIIVNTRSDDPKASNFDSKIEKQRVSIWDDSVSAIISHQYVNQWLGSALKTTENLSLVQIGILSQRKRKDPNRFINPSFHFSDAAPLLIANVASLEKLNESLAENNEELVDISHFRPNIVINGIPAFSEHRYNYVSDRQRNLIRLVDSCQRCIVITINPRTGQRRAKGSPMKTLAQLNSMPHKERAPAFGVNAELHCLLRNSDIHDSDRPDRTDVPAQMRLSLNQIVQML